MSSIQHSLSAPPKPSASSSNIQRKRRHSLALTPWRLAKGIDLSIYSQRDLDKIAHSLNTRPRAVLGFQTPEEVFMAELSKLSDALQI
jgi:IS30 family transposase